MHLFNARLMPFSVLQNSTNWLRKLPKTVSRDLAQVLNRLMTLTTFEHIDRAGTQPALQWRTGFVADTSP